MESNNIENMKIEIRDSLTCFICAAKVKDTMMCLKCKKLACSQCIKKWFETGHNICPFCKAESNLNSMISLPFINYLSDYFIKEIDNEEKNKKNINEVGDINNNYNIINDDDNNLSKTQLIKNKINFDDNKIRNKEYSKMKKKEEKCEKHLDKIIKYYCLNCNSKHCTKCLMINNEDSKIHYGHKIISIEQKNKFNLEEVKNEINNLSNVVNEIKGYKKNIELESEIIEKKEEFIERIIDNFINFIRRENESKKLDLDDKNRLMKSQVENINIVKNNYIDAINNFIEREDINGFQEYFNKIKKFKDINRYKQKNIYNIYLKPNLKFYETDFIQIDINEYNETFGEVYFNIEGINNQLYLKFNGEAINEVSINLLIFLKNIREENQKYYGSLLIKNKNSIIILHLDEKMIHKETLILGKTIIKSSLNNLVDQHNKCHAKIVLGYISL